MALPPGLRLGPYAISAQIGAGGMGEVYRATDSNLKRAVAIKVLPASMAADADRLARFQREAEVLAALNHPNIAAIYGLEKTTDFTALVMELVEGEDLSAHIARGAVPLAESLSIARQIADALEAAHEQGIIHRDLKPANVKVRADGTVKVLDFGLAKALAPEGARAAADVMNSPTLTARATQMGMILGTAAYMAPEQARGKTVDKRADIWAFGAVLFEMLTGARAFPGDDMTDTLAAVVRAEPDWTLIPPGLSPTLLVFLRRCLQKDPKQRIGDIRDVRLALEGAFETGAPSSAAPTVVAPPRPPWRRAVAVLTAVIVTAAMTSAGIWYSRPETPAPSAVRFPITLAEADQFTGTGRQAVAISRDGTQIVYAANRDLYRRALSELTAHVIAGTDTGTDGGVNSPVFSPDGRHIVFYSQRDRSLKKIPVGGGVAQALCVLENPHGMSWGEGGIVVGQGARGIIRVPESGGKPEQVVTVGPGELAHGPQVLPGGRTLLYTVGKLGAPWDQARVVVQSLTSGSAPEVVIEAGADARYVSTGHLIYALAGTLMAVPFDLGRLKVAGPPVTVVEGVLRSGGDLTGTAQFAISDGGSLAYIPGPVSPITGDRPRVLAFLNRRGGGLERVKVTPRGYAYPRVSPDGTRVAVSTEDAKGSQVWVLDLTGTGGQRQLTTEGTNAYPVWSPDSQQLAFQSTREGDAAIFWQRADGAGVAERLTKPETAVEHIPDSWSPDGQRLAFTRLGRMRDGSLWMLSLKDKTTTVFVQNPSSFAGRATFSPDGKWLAYQSTEGGQGGGVFVQPFPATGAKYLVARGGHPFWSPDGRELVINPGPNSISTIAITTQPSVSFGEPVSVPGGLAELASKNPSNSPRPWDYAPDGKRIFGIADVESLNVGTFLSGLSNEIQVVVNWFEDLKRLAPAK